MPKGCKAPLADGQWFHFCGETDMGQTLPALCEVCGGEFKRADGKSESRVQEILADEFDKELSSLIIKYTRQELHTDAIADKLRRTAMLVQSQI